MAERDSRYNRSRRGKARNKRMESTPARRRYKAMKAREYRARMKAEKGGGR